MPPLAIVRLARATVMQQLQLEEALLRSTQRSWFVVGWDPRGGGDDGEEATATPTLPPLAAKPSPSPPTLRGPPLAHNDDANGDGNDDEPPTIVLGISGKPSELIDLPLCLSQGAARARGPTAVRRFSGGGTVVVGRGAVLTSLIVSRGDLERRGVDPFPHPLMRWTARVYARVFDGKDDDEADLGGGGGGRAGPGAGAAALLTASSSPSPSPRPTFVLNENDYCVGDLKIAGNAQAITGGRALHHTSFLWDWRDEHMRLLLPPKRQPEYRRRRAHCSFLARVRERWPRAFPRPEDLALALEGAVCEEWGADGVEEADVGELRAALRGKHLRGNRRVDLRKEWEKSGGGGAAGL